MPISIPKRIKNPLPGSDTTYHFTGQATDCFTQTVNDTFKSLKDFVFESHRAKLLPNLFYGIHFGSIGRNMQQRNVFRNNQSLSITASYSSFVIWNRLVYLSLIPSYHISSFCIDY